MAWEDCHATTIKTSSKESNYFQEICLGDFHREPTSNIWGDLQGYHVAHYPRPHCFPPYHDMFPLSSSTTLFPQFFHPKMYPFQPVPTNETHSYYSPHPGHHLPECTVPPPPNCGIGWFSILINHCYPQCALQFSSPPVCWWSPTLVKYRCSVQAYPNSHWWR